MVTELQGLVARARADETFANAIISDEGAAKREAKRILPDTPVYWLVVGSLGAAVMVSLLGAIVLMWNGNVTEAPDILIATASGAVGALAGILNRT
ncbi:hypothetical protein GYB14_06745 [bacterium]|nr:hypothetical protein [bacterium]